MTTSEESQRRILDSAFSALARYGSQKLSMVDLSREASVSRGTVYRYFATKDDVLTALALHLRDTFEAQLAGDVSRRPELDDRVEVVVDSIFRFSRRREFMDIIEVDPRFVRDFFNAHFDEFVDPVAKALAPTAGNEHANLPRLDPWTVAEVLVRVSISFMIADLGDHLGSVEALHRTVERMLGRAERPAIGTIPEQPRARSYR